MNRGKIDIGRIKGWATVVGADSKPWWASCPHCPTKFGFQSFVSHGDAIDWTDKHLFKFHANDAFIFRVGQYGYPNKGEVRNDGR